MDAITFRRGSSNRHPLFNVSSVHLRLPFSLHAILIGQNLMASSSAPRNDRLADSYDSQSAFFEACKQLCQRTCGTISHDNNKTDNYARACCRLRRTQDCQWAVSAKLRDDGQWYIVTDTARWEHNHGWVDASQLRSSTGSEPVVMNNRKTRRVRSGKLTKVGRNSSPLADNLPSQKLSPKARTTTSIRDASHGNWKVTLSPPNPS